MRHVLMRFSPRLDGRWIIALLVVVVLGVAATMVRWGSPQPHLELLVLGPDGQFHDVLDIPADWADTVTVTPDAVVRFPLVLGVSNDGFDAARPGRLVLSLPLRYRLTGAGGEPLDGMVDPTSPLISYRLDPRLGAVEPDRMPTLLPAFETIWLEALVPRYYCVALGDSIPEFVPAPPPALHAMRDVRMLYSFEAGDLTARQTGTLTVRIDTSLLAVTMPEQPPSFPMEVDTALAHPDLGPLQYVGTRDVRCGEPEAPLEMVSTVWEAEGGARLITLDFGGAIRKHLYDMNGDGVIDRESWDPDGDGRVTATRRARLPIPPFLLPLPTAEAYDLAQFDELSPDSLARLDPLRGAMTGPGPLPMDRPDTARLQPTPPPAVAPVGQPLPAQPQPAQPQPVQPAPADPVPPEPAPAEPSPDPEPAPEPAPPLGDPIDPAPPPDEGHL